MPRFRLAAALATAASLALASTSALAQEAPRAPAGFGDAGQFALSINHDFIVNSTDFFSGGDELQGSYFVVPHLSLGLALGAQWLSSSPVASSGSSGSSSAVLLHAGPRVGYDIRLSDAVSIWPQVGVDYRRMSQSTPSVGTAAGGTTTDQAFGFTAMAPILLHPTRGFFVGAGPAFYTDISNSQSNNAGSGDNPKITSVGLMATLGGAF
jgi:hypothetical protein